jgi:hypothetical protein
VASANGSSRRRPLYAQGGSRPLTTSGYMWPREGPLSGVRIGQGGVLGHIYVCTLRG